MCKTKTFCSLYVYDKKSKKSVKGRNFKKVVEIVNGCSIKKKNVGGSIKGCKLMKVGGSVKRCNL